MKCMIVEDELPAVKILESYISKFKELQIHSIHHNAMDAMVELQKESYDILFLDIQLPGISGIQMLNSLKNQPSVILTTAHREYAIEGYELEITDYLLKPISFERFAKAIAKVYQTKQQIYTAPATTQSADESLFSEPFIYVKSEREHVKILLKDLLYLESIRNHVKLYTTKECIISMMSLSYIEEKLPEKHFLRIHKSYIISLQHINKFNQISVNIGDKFIPIGRYYKQKFEAWVNENIV